MTLRALSRLALSLAVIAPACAAAPEPPPRPAQALAAPRGPAPPMPAPRDDGRLPRELRPLATALELELDPSRPELRGRVRHRVELSEPTHHLVLHARELTIASARLVAGDRSVELRATPRPAARSKGVNEELVLSADETLPLGVSELELVYEGRVSRGLEGVYRVDEGGAPYLFTQLEPNDARRVMPCFDEPGFKLPITLSLVVPSSVTAFANAPERARRTLTDGRQRIEFEATQPIPSYLLAFGVGPLEVSAGDTRPVPVRIVTARGKAEQGALALKIAAEQLAILAGWFDHPYPYDKLDIVAVPNFGAGAMENAGFVTFREEFLLLGDKPGARAQRALRDIMAHELAHQWFGNLVTTAWWDDLWLNEGFASWMETRVQLMGPSAGAMRAELAFDQGRVMAEDALPSARRIRQPVRSTSEALEAFDGITYQKGAAVLDMVEAWVGHQKFLAGVRTYVKRHAFGNATADDLYAALGAASGAPVAEVMRSFTDQAGLPELAAKLECVSGRGMLALSQRRHRPLGGAGGAEATSPTWRLPVRVRVEHPEGSRVIDAGLIGATEQIALEHCPKWIWPNAEQRGYYVVAPSATDLEALTSAHRVLTGPERIGVVMAATRATESGALGVDRLIALLRAWRDEDERSVWQAMIEALRRLAWYTPDAHRSAIEALAAELLVPVVKRIGSGTTAGEPEETSLLRVHAVTALAEIAPSHPWVAAEGKRIGARFLADPLRGGAEAARLWLPVATREGDAALYESVERALPGAAPEARLALLAALAGFASTPLVERSLRGFVDGRFKAQDLRYVLPPLMVRPEKRRAALAWVEAHWAELARAMPQSALGRFVWSVGWQCTAPEVAHWRGFFAEKSANIEGADRDLRQAVEQAEICAALSAHHGPLLSKALGQR